MNNNQTKHKGKTITTIESQGGEQHEERSPLPLSRGNNGGLTGRGRTEGGRTERGRGTGRGTDTMYTNVELEALGSTLRRVIFSDRYRYSLRGSQSQQRTNLESDNNSDTVNNLAFNLDHLEMTSQARINDEEKQIIFKENNEGGGITEVVIGRGEEAPAGEENQEAPAGEITEGNIEESKDAPGGGNEESKEKGPESDGEVRKVFTRK